MAIFTVTSNAVENVDIFYSSSFKSSSLFFLSYFEPDNNFYDSDKRLSNYFSINFYLSSSSSKYLPNSM
jgi:hypothetical protein